MKFPDNFLQANLLRYHKTEFQKPSNGSLCNYKISKLDCAHYFRLIIKFNLLQFQNQTYFGKKSFHFKVVESFFSFYQAKRSDLKNNSPTIIRFIMNLFE